MLQALRFLIAFKQRGWYERIEDFSCQSKEDFERVLQLESIYVLEHKIQVEEEYYQWEERQNKLPAIITLNTNTNGIKQLNWEEVQEK